MIMSLLLIAAVGLLAFNWVRVTKARRSEWLARLNLPGLWVEQSDENALRLEFAGSAEQGRYSDGSGQRGTWQLVGHQLQLTNDAGMQSFALTFYDHGKIGLEPTDGGVRRFFAKQPTNVVQLHGKT